LLFLEWIHRSSLIPSLSLSLKFATAFTFSFSVPVFFILLLCYSSSYSNSLTLFFPFKTWYFLNFSFLCIVYFIYFVKFTTLLVLSLIIVFWSMKHWHSLNYASHGVEYALNITLNYVILSNYNWCLCPCYGPVSVCGFG
jgi:hypothetical protein